VVSRPVCGCDHGERRTSNAAAAPDGGYDAGTTTTWRRKMIEPNAFRSSTPPTNTAPNQRAEGLHRGVVMTGEDGEDGPKAFFIHIEALPGRGREVEQMLRDILACVEDEPATGPWYGVRYSDTTFGIFEAFPGIAGRQTHVQGGGGDIFRDVKRMNAILASPAHVRKVDVLFRKEVFAR
jgi:hypothetical protein